VELLWKKWPHAVHLANSQSQLFRNQCGLNNTKASHRTQMVGGDEGAHVQPMGPLERYNQTYLLETSRTNNHLGRHYKAL
jgi:hypothetical protein